MATKMLNSSRPFVFYALFVLAGLILLFFVGRDEFQLFVNRNLTGRVSDRIFGMLTHLGNGITAALVAVVLFLFYSFRKGIALGCAAIVTAIIVQAMKQLIFHQADRPIKYFHDLGIQDLNWPIGSEALFTYSFPSGHTATAFVLYFFLIFTIKKIGMQFLLFSVAILVGYSRIHLSQHFLTDVLAGSAIGFIMAFLAAKWFLKGGGPRLAGSLLSKKGLEK